MNSVKMRFGVKIRKRKRKENPEDIWRKAEEEGREGRKEERRR